MKLDCRSRPGRTWLCRWTAASLAMLAAAAWPAPGPEPAPSGQVVSAQRSAVAGKLFQALHAGDLPGLKAAIAEGADVNGTNTNGLPPLPALLHIASGPLTDAQRRCTASLLEHGAIVDARDVLGRTPLINATLLGDLETIRLLVQAEADVKIRDKSHKSALFYAVEANRSDIVLYLAANGDLVSFSVKEKKRLAAQR